VRASAAGRISQRSIVGARTNRRMPRRPWPVYTLEQVAEHCHNDDCWIVVNDKVYDMTPHVRNHEGWIGSGKVSTLLAILSAMGTDCTDDFNETHDANGFRELNAFQNGVLDRPNTTRERIKYYTWEQLVASGCIGDCPGMRAAAKAAAPDVCDICDASPCADGCPGSRRTASSG
jgi:hypothetical protein